MNATQWWHYTTEHGTYYAELGGTVRVYRDGELIATAPHTHGTHGDYVVTLTDGTVVGKTNWLRSVVAIAAQGVES